MASHKQPEEIRKGIEDLEKEITCPVCQDHFQEPKILPCCHVYCKGCVQKLAWRAGANQPFACPECRSDTFLPQNDPDQLTTAFFVNRLIELHSKMEKAHGKVEALCELCAGNKATAFCRQCAEFICDKCTEAHHRMKMFAGHKVATLEELKEGGAKIPVKQAPPPKCQIHDEQKKIYCYDCKHLICRDCLLDDHAGHKYEFVKKAAPAIKQKLAERLVPLKEVRVNLCDSNKSVKSTKSDIESQGASAVDKIEQSFQQLHDLLEQRKREMLEEASSLVKGKLDALSVQEKGIDMASGMIQSLVDFVERNIENATEEELMDVHTLLLLNRIDEETKKHQQSSGELEPVEEADIVVEVRCAVELRKLCREKAIVKKLPVDPAKSTVQGDGVKSAEINKLSKVTLHTRSPNGKPHKKPVVVKAKLTTISSGSVVEAKVKQGQSGTYEIEYTPCVRGRHQLEVTVKGLPVAGSPFPVLVKIPPTQLGKPIKSFTGLQGYGIAVNSKDELVFVEKDGDIIILDRTGKRLRSIKKSQYGFKTLDGVAVDDNDNIYVIDSDSKSVFKFNKNGTQIKVVKPAVKNPGLRGIAVSGNQVIVADQNNHQLLSFTRDLEFVKKIDLHSGRPIGVACDEEGKMYVCDYSQHRVEVLSTQGELLYSFGDKDRTSHKLSQPYSICVDSEFVYVSEWENCCVSVFTKQGKFSTSFDDGQLILPSGLAIDSDGVLYVCDNINSRVQMF